MLHTEGSDQSEASLTIGEDTDDPGATFDLVKPFQTVGGADTFRWGAGK